MTTFEVSGRVQYVTDPAIRSTVRSAIAHQLGLDIPAAQDAQP